ncbi:MAG: NifU family protein [Bacilli bacterium]|jgi:Fe-S cluster biogenesis protein NfuA
MKVIKNNMDQKMPEKNETIEEKIDGVLNKIRPFLQREGGDIQLERFDEKTGVCYVDMVGACSGCILAASDVSDSVQVMLMDEIPQITKVELVPPKETTEQGFEDLLKRLQEQQQADMEMDKINKEKAAEAKTDNTEEKK